jgi:hypothetical protein
VTDLAAFAELVPLDHGLCVFSTLRSDGAVQSSVVMAQERRAAVLITPRRIYTNPQTS